MVKEVIVWILTSNICKTGWKKRREPVCLRHSDLVLWLVKIQLGPILLEKHRYLEETGIQLRREKKAKHIILKSLDEILSSLAYFIPYQF